MKSFTTNNAKKNHHSKTNPLVYLKSNAIIFQCYYRVTHLLFLGLKNTTLFKEIQHFRFGSEHFTENNSTFHPT